LPQPAYADAFRCIGSECEDTCCQGWVVPVDRATWDKYQSLPRSPLAEKIRAGLVPQGEDPADQPGNSPFAIFRMDDANQCTLLTPDRLCSVQAAYGESLLSHACATFPRYIHNLGGTNETALTLSCPEAARLVLLESDLSVPTSPSHSLEKPNALPPHFWAIRQITINLIRDRSYPLWQRLFLLDLLCRRLDDLASASPDAGPQRPATDELLRGFAASLSTASLRPAMDKLPADPAAQLDIVLRLAGMLLHRSNVRPRFVECVQAFTAGIGNGPGATLATLTERYTQANRLYAAPFFARHPHILENFLINTILRCQFPFSKESMASGATPKHTREFATLAAQFVLIRGLLIGVAGHHGAAFGAAHVVHTVQSASKHFEHHPEFLNLAHALLVEARMDGPQGIAIQLRIEAEDANLAQACPAVLAATQASATKLAQTPPN
jgi:lysine-N-methylase